MTEDNGANLSRRRFLKDMTLMASSATAGFVIGKDSHKPTDAHQKPEEPLSPREISLPRGWPRNADEAALVFGGAANLYTSEERFLPSREENDPRTSRFVWRIANPKPGEQLNLDDLRIRLGKFGDKDEIFFHATSNTAQYFGFGRASLKPGEVIPKSMDNILLYPVERYQDDTPVILPASMLDAIKLALGKQEAILRYFPEKPETIYVWSQINPHYAPGAASGWNMISTSSIFVSGTPFTNATSVE